MSHTFLIIIFLILLTDSIGANTVSWFGEKWYTKHFKTFSRYFPAVKGWTAMYLALVIFIGLMIFL